MATSLSKEDATTLWCVAKRGALNRDQLLLDAAALIRRLAEKAGHEEPAIEFEDDDWFGDMLASMGVVIPLGAAPTAPAERAGYAASDINLSTLRFLDGGVVQMDISDYRRLAAEQVLGGRVVGSRNDNGVHVIIAKPFSELMPDIELVRYDDYKALAAERGKDQTDAVSLIAAERQRQLDVEGWTPEHDDEHDGDALAMAAVSYALPPDHYERTCGGDLEGYPPRPWPWNHAWWKPSPSDRVRELVKAGALIAAEIDRHIRKRTIEQVGGKTE